MTSHDPPNTYHPSPTLTSVQVGQHFLGVFDAMGGRSLQSEGEPKGAEVDRSDSLGVYVAVHVSILHTHTQLVPQFAHDTV